MPIALIAALFISAQPTPTIGYRVVDVTDATRTWRDSTPRPLRLHIWYPAVAGTGTPMQFGTYTRKRGTTRIGALLDTVLVPRDSISLMSRYRELVSRPVRARYAARRRAERAPVVVYGVGQDLLRTIDNLALAESLAERGFIVVAPARLGRNASSSVMTDVPGDEDVLRRDLEFALRFAIDSIRPTKILLASRGLASVAELAMMHDNANVTALATIDGAFCADRFADRALRVAQFDPTSLRGSLLSVCTSAIGPSARALRDTVDRVDRYWLDLNVKLPSLDFTMFSSMPDSNHQRIRDAVVGFFEHRVDNPALARQRGVDIPSDDQWVALVTRLGPDSTAKIATVKRIAYPSKTVVREAAVARIARDRLAAGDVAAALPLFHFNAAMFPDHVSSYDSLADTYRQTSDSANIVVMYRRLLDVVDRDSTLTDAQRADWRQYAAKRIAEYQR